MALNGSSRADLAARLAKLTPEQRRVLQKMSSDRQLDPSKLPITPQPRDGRSFPLALSQQRLWMLARLDPEDPVYNVPCHIRLRGPLRVDALQHALDALVARHEVLRTRFPDQDGEPVQILDPPSPVRLAQEDLNAAEPETRERLVSERATAQQQQAFDLQNGPLLRSALLRLAEEDHVLLMTMHHIISDGWSMTVLLDELSLYYNAAVRAEQPALDLLPVQYADYAVWQREWINEDLLQRQTDYWRRQLAGIPALLTLPWDRPRPPRQTTNGASLFFELDDETATALKRLSRETGTTLFMVCLGLFGALLGRYSGQDDIVVGTPAGGRSRKEIEGLIGFFVNSLAMRLDFSDSPSFRRILHRLGETAREAYAHQDVPFEHLVEQLRPQRNPSHAPIFQTWFVFRNQSAEDQTLEELSLTPLSGENHSAKFDLTLFVAEGEDGRFTGGFEYNRDLFDAATVERMRRRLQNLARQVSLDPDRPLEEISLDDPIAYPPIDPAPRTETLPLSYHQERLWFIDRFEKNNVYAHSPVYHNFPLLIEVEGSLDPHRLREALNRLTRRHRLLRTRFETVAEEPRQRVESAVEIPLSYATLGRVESEDDIPALALAANQEPIDLGCAPLARAVLFQGKNRSWFLLSLHHIIADPQSAQRLAGELADAYDGRDLPSLPQHDYGDYLLWQRQLTEEVIEPLLFHWRHRLRGKVAPLLLPTDRPRPAVHTYTGGRISFDLDAETAKRLRSVADQSGLEEETLLLAPFLVLLKRYSRQRELVVGEQASCREQAGFREIFGPLANLLVLRCDLEDHISFSDLCEKLQGQRDLARTHGQMPFDRLVQTLNPVKDMSRTALFDVLFTCREASTVLTMDGRPARILETGIGYGKYDLHLALVKGHGGLEGNLVFNADLHDEATAAQMADHYCKLVTAMVDHPEQPVAEPGLLSCREQDQQLQSWNDTGAQWPRQATLNQLFEAQAEAHPERIAISCGSDQLSYRDLEEKANRLAHLLCQRDVGRGELVALFLPRRPEMVVAMLAVLKAGAAYLPIDPDLPLERIAFLLEDSEAVHLVTAGELADRLPAQTPPRTRFEDPRLADLPVTPPERSLDPRDLAYCIYTSGSTGRPKGVLVEHANVVRLLINDRSPFDFSSEDVWSLFHSYCFDFSVWEIYGALLYGGRLVMVSKEQSRDPSLFADFLQEEGVTVLNQTPGAFYALSHELLGRKDLSLDLRCVVFGGEALAPHRLADFARAFPQVKLVNMYGITETTVHVTYQELTSREFESGASIIGRPIPTTQVYLLDEKGRFLPRGVAGEMWVGGEGVARGYLNRPELDAERFMPNPFRCGERLYRSGDLARYLPDGRLEYLGRLDDQVKIRGYRVELGEIESRLLAHPAIEGGVVSAFGAEDGLQSLAAYYIAAQAVLDSDLRAWLAQALPGYMVPAHFVRLERIPLTINGKVDRKALPHPQVAEEDDFIPPQSRIEMEIADIWRELLEIERISRSSDFFDLGGHSLLATRLVSRIRSRLAADLPVQAIFEHSRLADLAARVEAVVSEQERQIPVIEKTWRDQPLPLSFAQQRLWFLDRLVPDHPFYNCPTALRLQGELKIDRLEKAFTALVERHETLRTRFPEIKGHPAQCIDPPKIVTIPVHDLSSMPPEQSLEQAKKIARQEADEPFDLSRGPLFRVRLVRLSHADHLLLITLHHIISDGWSLGVLHREMSILYQNAGAEASPLGDLPVQYADFAVWQRNWLSGGRYAEQIDYWRKQLSDLEPLQLPTDRPRPEQVSYRGGVHDIKVSPLLARELENLSGRVGATLYMTMLAAFMTLLRRYSRQDNVAVGSPIANRTRSEIEGLIGFFVNTLVLRGDLTDNPSFLELVEQVRATALGAYAHQDIPFEQLVEELQPQRRLDQNPLVQVIFALQNAPGFHGDIPGLDVMAWDEEVDTVRFDLEVHFWQEEGELSGRFIFNRDLFDPETIARLARHYQALLQAICVDPSRRLDQLSFITPEERQLLERWSGEKKPYPASDSLRDLFLEQVHLRPQAPALRWQDGSLSYSELAQQAEALAVQLRSCGAGPDIPVGVAMERSPQMIKALVGILLAGGAYLPLDPGAPAERQRIILEQASVGILIADAYAADHLPAHYGAMITASDVGFSTTRPAGDAGKKVKGTPNGGNLAYVCYTSGSTGAPKGVMVTQRGVSRLVKGATYADFSPDQVFLQGAPLWFDASIFEIWGALLNGGCLALLPPGKTSLSDMGRCVQDMGVTTLWLTAGLFHLMVEEGLSSLRGLHQLLAGGDVLSVDHVRRAVDQLPGCRIINGYGPTEATTFTCCHAIGSADLERRSIPIGRPIANTRVYLLDEHMQKVPVGVPGQLYIGGPGLALGYLGDESLTQARFVDNPFGDRDGCPRLYASGDLARYLPDGNIEFLGRMDQQVKIRGFRIEPSEIENHLCRHPLVAEALVLPRGSGAADKSLAAYIVPRHQDAPAEDLRQWQDEHLEHWQNLYEDTYDDPQAATSDFNIVGWNSSYTGKPIPPEEMRIWLETTRDKLLALNPARVLEIGSGTGMIVAALAPCCDSYLATDFSAESLQQLQRLRDSRPELAHVKLKPLRADQLDVLEPASFDTIILNSVVQYFPSIEYLLDVLRRCTKLLVPGGFLFLGDIRNFRLMQTFHLSVERARASSDTTAAVVRKRAARAMAAERELLVDPRLFADQEHIPGLELLSLMPKGGGYDNELSRFRYDLVLRKPEDAQTAMSPVLLGWQQDELTLERLGARLTTEDKACLAVTGVPNPVLQRERQWEDLLCQADREDTISCVARRLREPKEKPSLLTDLAGFAEEREWKVRLFWPDRQNENLEVDVLFYRQDHPAPFAWPTRREHAPTQPLHTYANSPMLGELTRSLVPQLRGLLEERLPDYMLPASYNVITHFPLTPNGKVDRRSLPDPDQPAVAHAESFVPPRSPVEIELAGIWKEILHLEQVGLHDDFFQLGGHSLLATQMVSRIRRHFGKDIPLRRIFEVPTIAGLAPDLETADKLSQDPILPRRGDAAPSLSFAQQRLWFLDRLGQGMGYVMPLGLNLKGKLDLSALRKSLAAVVARHEVLRTVFDERDGEPFQRILPAYEPKLAVTDLSCIPMEARRTKEDQFMQEFFDEPFDLVQDPMLRVLLMRRSNKEHLLLVALHHIAADGWSLGILTRELAEFYRAFTKGQDAALRELPIQYADFACWQRGFLKGPERKRQLDYWRKQLTGVQELQLPLDRPRPERPSYSGERLSMTLPRQLTIDLERLSGEAGCSLFMTLLSGFAALLGRHCDQEDIAVGTPIANRNRQEIEPLIGFFVNTLVLRCDLAGDPSFQELLERVRNMTLDAYAHQEIPFEQLVDALNPARNLNRNPLFQVLFALQNVPEGGIELPEMELGPVEFPGTTSRFDLEVHFYPEEQGLRGEFIYNPDLFERETVSRLACHLQNLLAEAVATPQVAISLLPLLSPEEEAQIARWNDTARPFDRQARIEALFETRARCCPDAPAVECDGHILSYRELDQRAAQVAARLRAAGVGPEVPVGLYCDRSPDLIVALLAILKSGGAYVPLDPDYPAERLQFMLDDAGIGHLLSQKHFAPQLDTLLAGRPIRMLLLDDETAEAEPSISGSSAKNSSDLAYVLYTSGSTGRPKGVEITHRSVAALLSWACEVYTPRELRRVLASTSVCFDLSVYEIFLPLMCGGTVVLVDNALSLREKPVAVSMINTVPSAMGELVRHRAIPATVETINLAGEPLKGALVQEIFAHSEVQAVYNLYGPSEDTTYSTWVRLDREFSGEPSIGVPISNTSAHVLDRHGRPAPVGVTGELYLGGEGLARGYRNRPELTAERFVAHPFGQGRLYRTGDLVRRRADGTLEFLGRRDHQVKIRGYRIELGEIEAALARHEAVRQSVVVAREAEAGPQLIAYVETDLGQQQVAQLRAHLRRSLPEYMVPGRFVLLEQLPLTPNGKIDRSHLPEPESFSQSAPTPHEEPRGALEKGIQEIFATLLGAANPGRNENFFEIGGHSLLATRLTSRLQERYQVNLALTTIFEAPSIAGLAEKIEPLANLFSRPEHEMAEDEEEIEL